MSIRNRGLSNQEQMGLNMATITASGLEAIISGSCFLYTVHISEELGADGIKLLLADAASSGTVESLQFNVASANLASGANVDDLTREWNYSPPLHFESGVFASSTGLAIGSITFGYKQ